MPDIIISTKPLTSNERFVLERETKKSADIGFISQSFWKKFTLVYTLRNSNLLIGACAVVPLKNWIKIGPIIVREVYQGNGYGKKLLYQVTDMHRGKNLYIGSSHPAVMKTVKKLGFRSVTSFWRLPRDIQIYLCLYFIQRLGPMFLLDILQKQFVYRRGKYYYFLKYA